MAGNDRRTNLSALERGLSLSLGALAASAALRRREPVSASLFGAAAGLLLYRGVTGRSNLYRRLGISGSDVGGTVTAGSQVTVQLEPTRVHRYLRNLTNLHLFSRYADSAQELGDERWRVWLRAPTGGEHQLEVRRTAEEEGRRLAWASVGESSFPAALELRFAESRTGTEVHADLWFVPPAPPVVSKALTWAERSRPLTRAGLTPSQLLEQELRRLRQLLEAGETATVKGQSAGGKRTESARSAPPEFNRELV